MKNIVLNVHKTLDSTYPEEISFLEKRSPFQFLISVILSAQTTDERVNQVTPELFAKYPTAYELSAADLEDVKTIIRPTGFFNNKAKNIIACAKAIVEKHNGETPQDMDALLALPGVGRKTAHCLRSSMFGLPGIIVDTHFSRVVNRVFGLGTREPDKVETFVSENLPKEHWSRFSMTVNLHGRECCHAAKPQCSACPLKNICKDFPIE